MLAECSVSARLGLVKSTDRKYLWCMARKAAWEELAEADLGPYGKSRGTNWGRLFVILLFVAGATFAAAYYVPLYRAHQKLADQYRELGQRAQNLSEAATKAQTALKTTAEQRDQLQAKVDQADGLKQSAATVSERGRAVLAAKLDKFLKKGSAAVVVSGGSLFVALDSAILFQAQKLDLTPPGRALLCDIEKSADAKSLVVRASVTQGGAVAPALASTYPSAWALSAARAAAVTQALQETCAIPASQLSASGNGVNDPLAAQLAAFKPLGERIELELTLH